MKKIKNLYKTFQEYFYGEIEVDINNPQAFADRYQKQRRFDLLYGFTTGCVVAGGVAVIINALRK